MSFSFAFYDLWFLFFFTVAVLIFLIIKRKNLSREGIMFLYRTKIGLRAIDYLGTHFKKTLKCLSYLIVALGYFLMIIILYLFIKSVYAYIAEPRIVEIIKAPPVMLLIPYFPQIFGVQQFFPDFPFVYFLIAIAIIAIVHEGFHGVYAKFYKVRIKSTGFGFLGPFLAFFVEQDDKQMTKKGIFQQLTIISAGVFANILTAVIFFFILWSFFSVNYAPSGMDFVSYSYSLVGIDALKTASIIDETVSVDGANFTKILISEKYYLVDEQFLKDGLSSYSENSVFALYQYQPAIKNNLKGTIIKINNIPVISLASLRQELDKYQVGEEVKILMEDSGESKEYSMKLGESYEIEGKSVLGIIIGSKNDLRVFKIFEFFKENGVAYQPKSNPELMEFIYNLFAWIIVINLLVGLINMLPMGIFDGGRFFYLTILAIVKKESIAKKCYQIMTQILLLGLFLLMFFWILRRFIL